MNLVPLNKPVNQSLVEHLEHFLAEAKAGEIRGISYVVQSADGSFVHGGCGSTDAPGMAAVMMKLALRTIGM